MKQEIRKEKIPTPQLIIIAILALFCLYLVIHGVRAENKELWKTVTTIIAITSLLGLLFGVGTYYLHVTKKPGEYFSKHGLSIRQTEKFFEELQATLPSQVLIKIILLDVESRKCGELYTTVGSFSWEKGELLCNEVDTTYEHLIRNILIKKSYTSKISKTRIPWRLIRIHMDEKNIANLDSITKVLAEKMNLR